jgi:transposase-like protein
MSNTRRRDPQREQRWRQAIAGWKKSGQSIQAYCAARGLSEASFYAWRRELAKRDLATPPAVKFLPVHVRAEAILEVALPNGLVVRVPAGAEASTVAALVAALGTTPC